MCEFQRAVTMIPAHDNPLVAIAFNAQGTKLATASEKVSLLDWHVRQSVCIYSTLCLLAAVQDSWWPFQTVWIQMRPHKMMGLIWYPNYFDTHIIYQQTYWMDNLWVFERKNIYAKLKKNITIIYVWRTAESQIPKLQ